MHLFISEKCSKPSWWPFCADWTAVIHQNCVVANDLNIFPAYYNIVFPAKQAEPAKSSVYNKCCDPCGGHVNFKVADTAEAHSILYVNNFFMAHIVDSAVQPYRLPVSICMPLRGRIFFTFTEKLGYYKECRTLNFFFDFVQRRFFQP